jgi:hypothetical protein
VLKSIKNGISKNPLLSFAIFFIFVLVGFWGWFFITGQTDKMAEWFVAIGTILLAFATFASMIFAVEQEKRNRQASLASEARYREAETRKEDRYRKDQREKEHRDRKERLLNEMRVWIADLSSRIAIIPLNTNFREKPDESPESNAFRNIMSHRKYMEYARIEIEYFITASEEFRSELVKSIADVSSALSLLIDKADFLTTTLALNEGSKKKEQKERDHTDDDSIHAFVEFFMARDAVCTSAKDALKLIAKAKLALLKQEVTTPQSQA